MAYRIVYGPMPEAEQGNTRGPLRLQMLTAVFLLLFVLLVRQVSPDGTEMLRSFFLPGEPSATEQAFSEMVNNLREGEPAGEAITAFCRQIIDSGTQRTD